MNNTHQTSPPHPGEQLDQVLDRIRSLIEVDPDARVHHDGSVSHITNAEAIIDSVEGLLEMLVTVGARSMLSDLGDRFEVACRANPRESDRLNAYIRLLVELREELPEGEAPDLTALAIQAEQELLDVAAASPYLTTLPNGELIGDPGNDTERVLLSKSRDWLQKLLAGSSVGQKTELTEVLLERACSAYMKEITPGARMQLINQILAYWRRLAAGEPVS